MPALTLNPGFVLVVAAFLMLITPGRVRAPLMGSAALLALWLLLDHEFGAAAAMAQMGLPVVLLDLDELNRIFGIALLIALAIVAIYSSARRNRAEDAALLLMAGGSVTALFVGDLVSFVAAAALSALGAAWVVFTSPVEGASGAGVRLLMWVGLEGLLFLIGVALRLSAGAQSSVLSHLDAEGISGGFILAALMIRVGAPFAHVWPKDVVSHAAPAGAAALTVFSNMLGVYGLARFFPAEQVLIPVGMVMIVVGAFFAAAEVDLRRAGAYALTAQSGVCVSLIGIGTPFALAAAEAFAFAAIFSLLALQMTLGGIYDRTGAATIESMRGLIRSMPVSVMLLFMAGLAASGAPGFAMFAGQVLALDATSEWELRALWAVIAAASGVVFVSLALRPLLAANQPADANNLEFREARYTFLLGGVLSTFFCIAVGMAPRWLYGLLPGGLSFQPYDAAAVGRELQILGASGAVYLALRSVKLEARMPAGAQVLDIDAFYEGPLAGAGRWVGVIALRIQGAFEALMARLIAHAGALAARGLKAADQPYRPLLGAAGVWGALVLAVLTVLIVQRLPE